MSRVAFADDVAAAADDKDEDDVTNAILLREQKNFTRARLQGMRIMSVIAGNYNSRKKVFSEILESTDYKTYEIQVVGKTLRCAKVFNPALLARNSKTWTALADVQRFELEDPEGTLTSIPKHYAANMQHLESFSITWTRVKSLPVELFRHGLKTLSLQRNHVKTLNGIEKAVDLSNLDASSNLLTELPKTLGQLQNLTTLNVSGNAIRELPVNFGSLNQLRVLDCSCNRLAYLPDSVENLIELMSLDVSNNHLTELPETIGNMPKLEDLRARGNRLQFLPSRFDRLVRLGSLILRKNRFEEVPSQLSNISSLRMLNMRENSIRSFPRPIPSLKTLILDSNQLGEIGAELLGCRNVELLSLENNAIGSIPDGINSLKYLRVLHLGGNPLDAVPENIDQLEKLCHLSLKRTNIRTLPTAIARMNGLSLLDIDDCAHLTDPYLRKELKENGIAGLQSYIISQNSRSSCNLIQTNRKTELPSYFVENEGPISDPKNDQQLTLVHQQNRVTLFAPLSNSVNQSFAGAQRTADQKVLRQSNTTQKEESNELTNLSSIRESKSEDDFADDGAVTYGTVNKSKGIKGICRKLRPNEEEGEAERLHLVDSGALIRQRLDAQDTGSSDATKRQSHI